MYNMIDLSDKVIVVVGASSGIGRQVSITISALGGKVVAIARSENNLQETISMLEGEGHKYYMCDLAETENVAEIFKRIKNECGRIDGIVYSAGIAKDAPLNMIKTDKLNDVFDVNYYGFIECVRWVCKKGYYNEGMSIVAISSVCSIVGSWGHIMYSSSKAAIDGAIRCLATETASKGIRVNSILPGMIDTQIYRDLVEGAGGEDAEPVVRFMNKQYLGLGKVEDVSNMVAFLLSSASRMITGVCIPVDGGYSTN